MPAFNRFPHPPGGTAQGLLFLPSLTPLPPVKIMPPDPSVPSSSQPAWAALATAIAGAIAVLAKKSFPRRAARPSTINYQPSTMLVTQQQLDAMRDRVTAG